jgi:hypothetical protein
LTFSNFEPNSLNAFSKKTNSLDNLKKEALPSYKNSQSGSVLPLRMFVVTKQKLIMPHLHQDMVNPLRLTIGMHSVNADKNLIPPKIKILA